ncbi:hypothetical protein JTB14_010332 [Gonioctena quinquepunctata]|nr:hypothetical protein JTB14_010332 [Gonioctena quinquepunctata]
MLPVITMSTPAASSVNQWIHYAQNIKRGKFVKFDYGQKENLQRYGVKEPPPYTLSRATFPVALFTGANDLYATKEGIEDLVKDLPNIVEIYEVPNKEWTHIDMIWGRDVDTLLNGKILQVMKEYNDV